MRPLEIANELGAAHRENGYMNITLKHLREDIEARKVYLTPAEGWPGKNADERNTNAEKAFQADEAITRMVKQIREIELSQVETVAKIEALEAERRGFEWEIRIRLVDALMGAGINHEEGSQVEAAFDDVMQTEFDQALEDELVDEAADAFDTGELPF